jgi:hypothetical protein
LILQMGPLSSCVNSQRSEKGDSRGRELMHPKEINNGYYETRPTIHQIL